MRIRPCTGVAMVVAVAAALLLWGDAPALAHAQLRSATPAAGSSAQTAPAEVVVNFSEPLEGAFSMLVVRDAAGKRVDKADSRVEGDNKTTIRVSLPRLESGTYTVDWRAVSTDSHRVNGSFTFRVGQ